MQDCPDAKKPCKGILKTSSSFDKPGASYRKSAKFDELNVLQTYHPLDKDYGHMKIDEPKTPYNYADMMPGQMDQLDADLLAEKLRIAANTQTPSFGADDLSDDDFPETEEEKVRRLEFERRRKAHYNEFEAVRLARKLIEEELDDEDEEEVTLADESTSKTKSETDFSAGEESREEPRTEPPAVEADSKPSTMSKTLSILDSNSETNSTATLQPPAHRPMDVDAEFDPSHPCAGRE